MKLTKVESIKYHRNGVGGVGFFVVIGTWKEGRESHRMMVQVFPDGENIPSHYSCIDLDDPTARWRGDHFVDAAWKAVRERKADEVYS